MRCHVEHGAHTCSIFLRVFFSQFFGESEIGEFGSACFDEYVLCFDVAVGDVVVVEYARGIDDISEDGQCVFFSEWSPVLDELFEIAACVCGYMSQSSMKM